MATPKTFAGLTFQQIGLILVIVTPVLTIQTLVLNLMGQNREYKYEQKQNIQHQQFNDELARNFEEILESVDNVYTKEDISDLIDLKVTAAEKSTKDYVNAQNAKQDDLYQSIFKHTIENAYYTDSRDSTFKVFFYFNEADSVVILKMIPILTSDFENGIYE